MLNSVRIGEKDLYTEFGCILMHIDVGIPSARTKFVDIPLRNGKLDLTELLTDEVKYESRPVKIDLKYAGDNLLMVQSQLANYLHGKRYTINFDEDLGYFYIGRISLTGYDVTNYGGKIHLTAECDPYKYTINSSIEDWEWDPFDFEEGYINELSSITVSGPTPVSLIAGAARVYPKVISDAQMNVTFGTKTIAIGIGSTTLYDFELNEGENILTFTGNGTVQIDYRGGRL